MKTRTTSGIALVSTAQTLLRRVFRILNGCGISASRLKEMSDQALREITEISASTPNRVTARQALMCSDIVLKWRRDCAFVDDGGMPALLTIRGASPSFANLVESVAPGTDQMRILETMQELGIVRITQDQRAELITDSVVVCSGRDGAMDASEFVIEHICGFLGSVEYNVFDKPSRARGRFERACYASVPENLVPILEQLVSARGQDFVDVIDEWLARRAIKNGSTASSSVLVGAGAYVFVRENVS